MCTIYALCAWTGFFPGKTAVQPSSPCGKEHSCQKSEKHNIQLNVYLDVTCHGMHASHLLYHQNKREGMVAISWEHPCNHGNHSSIVDVVVVVAVLHIVAAACMPLWPLMKPKYYRGNGCYGARWNGARLDLKSARRVAQEILLKINRSLPGHAVFAGMLKKGSSIISNHKKWPLMA